MLKNSHVKIQIQDWCLRCDEPVIISLKIIPENNRKKNHCTFQTTLSYYSLKFVMIAAMPNTSMMKQIANSALEAPM